MILMALLVIVGCVPIDHAQHDQGERGNIPAGCAVMPVPYFEVFRALGAEAVLARDRAGRADIGSRVGAPRRDDACGRGPSARPPSLACWRRSFRCGNSSTVRGPCSWAARWRWMILIVFFKLVIVALAVITVLISMDYDVGRHVGEYYAVLLFGAVGMMLLISAEELITIFVALELTSISLYILTAFHKGELRSQEAAVKYFMFGAMSSAFLLFGLSYVYGVTGTTSLQAIRDSREEYGRVGDEPAAGDRAAVYDHRFWIQSGRRSVPLVGAGRV